MISKIWIEAFRCAYCLFYNEARKTKLAVPKLSNINDLNESNSSTSNLSSATSFDDIIGTTSEPIISSSSLRTELTAAKQSHHHSNENLTKNAVQRKGSLTDSTNQLNLNSIQARSSSKSIDTINSHSDNNENKENIISDDEEDYEKIQSIKKFN